MSLSWWRTRGGSEVDLVLYGAGGFWAIEVKNTDRLRPADTRGLRAFIDDYPEARALLLYQGEPLVQGSVRCLPVEPFLRALVPGVELPV